MRSARVFTLALSVALVLLLTGVLATKLAARVRCLGEACAHLPADDARRQVSFLSLQLQLQEVIRRQHLRAAINANTLQGAGGMRLAENKSVSLGTSTAWTPTDRAAIGVPGAGIFFDLPVSGTAVAPSFSFGSNLRRLLGSFRSDGGADLSDVTDRLELRFAFMEAWTQDQDLLKDREESARGIVRTRGLELRYALVTPRPEGAGQSLRFLGVLLSAGAHGTRSTLKIRQAPTRAGYVPTEPADQGQSFVWDTESLIRMKSSVLSLPLEARSGVSLFNVADLYVAIGVSHHQGSGRFSTVLSGPVYSASNATGATAGAIWGASPQTDALLAALLSGRTEFKRSLAFGKVGLEVGSARARFGLELAVDAHARGFRIGLSYSW